MLVALHEGKRVDAVGAVKGPPYLCPGCRSEVVLKQGTRVVHHFAHKPPVTCAWAQGETQLHLAAKSAIRDAFRARSVRAEVEWEVLSSGGDRRADVVVWLNDRRQVAFEIQHQPLDPRDILRRTQAYMAAGVPVIWVSLRDKIWQDAKPYFSGILRIKKYSPRPWELWAHGLGYRKLWFYRPDDKTLWAGAFTEHMIEVPSRDWWDGEERSAGGYSRPSKRWRTLTLTGPHELAQVQIRLGRRQAHTAKGYHWPSGLTADLTPPTSD